MVEPICGECARRELLKALKDLSNQVPLDPDNGFGAHNSYVFGLVSGIVSHIDGVIAEIEKVQKDGMQDGSLFEKEAE
jgi:hypothetical protein